MSRRVPIAEAKAKLSAIVDEVLHRGERVVIERHGKPVAVVVSLDDLARLEEYRATTQPPGILGLVGAWRDVPDEEIDAWLADVYATRALPGREVNLEP
jgi:prevent-host-death family protein